MILRTLITIALLAVSIPANAQGTPPQTPPPAQTLDAIRMEGLADGLMLAAMQDYDVAGAAVTIVSKGEVVLARGYGVARLEPQMQPATADTLFQVASVSKLPVYIAAMQQVERGALKLEDPVNDHLPDTLRLPDEGQSEPIRVRDLLSHTAGFEDLALGHLFAGSADDLTPLDEYLKKHRPKRVRPPGEQPVYSNYSLLLLGRIIEEKSGTPFADYMDAEILRPLGLATAAYRDPFTVTDKTRPGVPAPLPEAAAALTSQQMKGSAGNWKLAQQEFTSTIAPAGGLRISARDMGALLIALGDPKKVEAAGVLKASTFEAMLKGPIVTGGPRVHHGFIPYELPGGLKGIGHGGAMAGSASDFVLVPELDLGVFVTTNTRGGFAFAYDFASRLVEGLAPSSAPVAVRNAETQAAAKALTGAWIDNRRAFRSTERALLTPGSLTSVNATPAGDLLIGGLGAPATRYVPVGDGRWVPSAPGGWSIEAVKTKNGALLIQSGSGVSTLQRAGFWQRAETLILPVLLTFIACAMAIYGWPGRWSAARAASPAPLSTPVKWGTRALDAAVIAWALGLAGYFAAILPAATDGGAAILFRWPGPLGWATWMIALAAVLTLAAWASLPALRPASRWSLWRKAKHGGALLLFTFTALACWHLGLIGFSGS